MLIKSFDEIKVIIDVFLFRELAMIQQESCTARYTFHLKILLLRSSTQRLDVNELVYHDDISSGSAPDACSVHTMWCQKLYIFINIAVHLDMHYAGMSCYINKNTRLSSHSPYWRICSAATQYWTCEGKIRNQKRRQIAQHQWPCMTWE